MEQLAKTCKILYDKDYLDSKKRLKENDIYAKVKYDSWKEYETLCEEFKKELPKAIKRADIDDWTYREYGIEFRYGLQFSCDCERKIAILLTKLTKDQNKKWVEHISNIIGSIIRGLAKSVSLMDHLGEEIQENFENREMCNIMITHMIIALLLGSEDVQEEYELEKLRNFVCKNCKKEDNILYSEYDYNITFLDDTIDEMCYECCQKQRRQQQEQEIES